MKQKLDERLKKKVKKIQPLREAKVGGHD